MYIRRDYTEPFFKDRHKRRPYGRILLFLLVIVGLGISFYLVNRDQIDMQVQEMMGNAPTPTPFPSELATRANNLALAGELEQAATLFQQAITQQPNNIDYLYEYGRLLIDLEDYQGALDIAGQITEININDPRGYALEATGLVFTSSPSAAIPIAVTGIELDPTFAPLYSALARAYVDTARYEDALNTGLQAVQLAPYDADAHRSYAYVLTLSGAPLEASNELEQAIAIDPNRIPAYFELAFLYLSQNRDEEAINLYNQVLAIQPGNAQAYLRLCLAHRKIGQFQSALGFCQDSVNADPTSSSAQYQLGRMLYNNRDWQGAMDAFTACSEINPSSLECNYYRGLTYFYLGDCDNSWTLLFDSLAVARDTNAQGAIEDIQLGMQAVGDLCPQYRTSVLDSIPTPTLEIQSTTEGQ